MPKSIVNGLIKAHQEEETRMAKNMIHYFKDGTKHPGGTHKMPNGDLHSGSKHGTASKKLYHYAELPSASAKKKARKRA